jgi:choline dehydrogenase-like flavoprotein
VRVDKVTVENGRAVGVEGIATSLDVTRKDHKKVRLRARRGVIVAASTIQSPNILRRSGVRSKHLGEHFQAHPGVGMGGLFDQPVSMHVGATQGAESIHYRRSERLKFETIAMQPELAAVRIPGIGTELMKRFGDFSHLGVWCVLVRSEAEGTVRPGWGGHDKVTFNLTRPDMQQLRKGAAMLARMFFDAGAREVWPGIYGVPSVIRSMDEVKLIEESSPDARNYSFVATHLFGAARMGPDPSASVVNLDFETHECKGLYVVDSSVFPTNLGVNPQHSIMALSRLAATRIALRERVPVAARSGVKVGDVAEVHTRA